MLSLRPENLQPLTKGAFLVLDIALRSQAQLHSQKRCQGLVKYSHRAPASPRQVPRAVAVGAEWGSLAESLRLFVHFVHTNCGKLQADCTRVMKWPTDLGSGHSAMDSVDYSECRHLVKVRDGHLKSVKGANRHYVLAIGWTFRQRASSCIFGLGVIPTLMSTRRPHLRALSRISMR